MAEPVTVQAELYHGHDIESEDTSSLRIITADGVEIIFNQMGKKIISQNASAFLICLTITNRTHG